MGDFASPAAGPNGGLCINSGMNPGSGGVVGAAAVGIPKHSTVVERLRQRIEGCRRHHVNCESRYQQAHAEQLEIERRETVSLFQRTLEQRAKKSGGGGGGSKPSKQPEPDSASSTEQRNNTLIALQETVKRKLDSARSPLNGEQNGICDGGSYSPTSKRVRKDGSGGLDSLTGLPNSNSNVPPISPLHHQMDIKPLISGPNTSTGNSSTNSNGTLSGRASDELGKNGISHLSDMKLNGSLDLEDSFGLLKDLKQEPLDDGGGMESSDPQSLSNQNKLFSDINLNDQEWQELIDELTNTVPEDDMHDLFNEDFEDKKEADFGRPTNNPTPGPQESSGNTTAPGGSGSTAGLPPPAQPPQGVSQVPIGSPQVRPSSSGPQFATTANGTPPQQPLQQSPAVAMVSGSPLHNCVARSPQTPTQAQTQAVSRSGNGFMMNPGQGVNQAGAGPGAASVAPGGQPVGPVTPELSPAEQLKAMAQQCAKRLHQKQQQAANWSPAGAPTSPYNSAPFNQDKPNSPMMYAPQAFNTPQGALVSGMAPNNGPKAPMNNYLPHNHMGMMGQQQPNNINQNALSKQQQQQQTAAMLSYSNTKPLTHFTGSGVDHMGQRMTPPMGGSSQVKNPMMTPYMSGAGGGGQGAGPCQTQGPIPGQTAHPSEDHKRIMMMKQKPMNQTMPYSSMQHAQDQSMGGMSRPPGAIPPPHPAGGVATGVGPNQGSGPPPGYLANQQQAVMMKKMAMEQGKRAQMQMMEQHRKQQLLAEQLQQQHHLPRQMGQGQRNSYPQVNQYQGPSQDLASRNQPLQSIRAAHLLQQQRQQQQQMVQMTSVQGQGGSVGPQSEMGLPYGTQGSNQSSLYGLNPSMSQMIHQQQHQSQSVQASMGLPQHNPVGPPRQAGAGPGVGGMPGGPGGGGPGYGGPGMIINSMTQQPLKGPPNAKAQAQRLQSMLGGGGMAAGGWSQQQGQSLQAMGGAVGRTTGGGGGDMVGFSSAQGYGMQPNQPPRMAKQHFPGPGQALSQGMDPRVGNPAAGMGGPMMGPHMGGQPRTNQPRPMVMNQGMNQGMMGQGMASMGGFGPGPGGPGMGAGGGGGGPYGPVGVGVGGQSQGYQRTANQDMSSYGYGGGSSDGVAFGLGDGSGVELDSSDGWMEQLFPNQ
ncbi:mastermind-like protein 3 isoform X1 [Oryzias melastigma]|uniref:Mastermind-like transcriptional coactivator 3 n=2 Tax=Oryzias melastigma TaxID=30732 RepID=A0A3B3DYC1_ORYME|nr:mastermind-like protein 3 isoform X1 [Oryzias melastigma]XP_024145789.1 mastermind-like protein 3 isoform X1 [Oryzias melastigma]XP_036069640.1 mastermind-like protein 3 isoform X1 [Oryzias melastigma]